MSGSYRNKPCHCGSGEKYKKCHLIIEEQKHSRQEKKLEIHELQKIFDSTLHTEICVASDLNTPKICTNKIINAHTLTKSLSLEKIAQNGHVYSFKNKDLFFVFQNKGLTELRKIGVRTASTFKGFCSYHDDYLFSSLEKENFILKSEQILALFYRSFALEYYKKQNVLDNARKSFKPLIKSFNVQKLDLRSEMIVGNIKRAKLDFKDTLKIKDKIVGYFNNRNDISLRTYALKINNGIPFVCTGLFALYKDISNETLQDIYDYELVRLEYLSLNIFYAKDGSAWIVLNWFEDDNLINKFINRSLS